MLIALSHLRRLLQTYRRCQHRRIKFTAIAIITFAAGLLYPSSQVAALYPSSPSYITEPRQKQSDDSLRAAIKTAESGMQAQSTRLKVIAQNLANSEVSSPAPGVDPYRRKVIFFKNVPDIATGGAVLVVEKIDTDKSPYTVKYEPHHPAADRNGYVLYPNVSIIVENVDAKEAERSFAANTNSLTIAKSLAHRTLELMK